jgi:hypothetical protein
MNEVGAYQIALICIGGVVITTSNRLDAKFGASKWATITRYIKEEA